MRPMIEPLAIAAIGAGRVFQRLYLPALARVPGLRLAAVADPSTAALASVPEGVATVDRLDELFSYALAGVLVLSPAALHADHARLVLERGIPILLEKPSASVPRELEAWPGAWRALVTPARPRRYWREYLAIRRSLRPGESLRLEFATSPAGWGASTTDSVADDLLPHVHDLAGWLRRAEVIGVDASLADERGAGSFHMSDGRTVDFEIAHGNRYMERVTAGDVTFDLSATSLRDRVVHRLHGRPPRDIEGVSRMLRLWERRLRGEHPPGLPAFDLAAAEVRMRAQLLSRFE